MLTTFSNVFMFTVMIVLIIAAVTKPVWFNAIADNTQQNGASPVVYLNLK